MLTNREVCGLHTGFIWNLWKERENMESETVRKNEEHEERARM